MYIGDGASLTRPIVRRRDGVLFGHTTVRAQLQWCERNGVPQAYFTHCGKQIVTMDGRERRRKIAALAPAAVETRIAYDGLRISLS